MKFIDEVKIEISSGNGGHGAVSFRREKFVPRGGPDGGNGGKGGDVYFVGDENLNTLVHFRGIKSFRAEDGNPGRGAQADGRTGSDLLLKVPLGTVVISTETGVTIADIKEHDEKVKILQGGRGGLGNTNFKSSTNQTPRYAQDGEEGKTLEVQLELKLLADIALVGLPNAGKSTLISCLSAAKPKIADYPFTTLEPNLGVVKRGEKSFVIADIPGLIEDASEGKGLGHKFLKHIERSKAICHLVDCSMFLEPFEAIEAYSTVRAELLKYSEKLASKKELICITKIDAMTEEEIERFIEVLENELDRKVLPISSVSGLNLDKLQDLMIKMLEAAQNS